MVRASTSYSYVLLDPGSNPHQVTFFLYILVQSFRVTGLFADQYNTEDYGTFTGVIVIRQTQYGV